MPCLERILPAGFSISRAMRRALFPRIAARRRRLGNPIAQADAQIASIAQVRSGKLATRRIADFRDCGIDVIDPWDVVLVREATISA